jgi:voltage-gated potassium channel Kch
MATGDYYKNQLKIPKDIWNIEGPSKDVGFVPKVFFTLLAALLLLTPAVIIKGIFDRWNMRSRAVEVYVVAKLLVLLFILFYWGANHLTSFVVTTVLLVELSLYLFGVIFLHKYWGPLTSIERSIFLMIINFIEIVVGFSIIYLNIGGICIGEEVISSPIDALYFSVVTITTLGYGEILPKTEAGKIAVMLQVCLAVLFFAVMLGSIVGKFASEIKIRNKEN